MLSLLVYNLEQRKLSIMQNYLDKASAYLATFKAFSEKVSFGVTPWFMMPLVYVLILLYLLK